jgi:hypothetical protein
VNKTCHRDVTTDSMAPWPGIRKADRSHASGPPMPGEGRERPNGPADGEEPECRTPEQMSMANAFCRYLEMSTIL